MFNGSVSQPYALRHAILWSLLRLFLLRPYRFRRRSSCRRRTRRVSAAVGLRVLGGADALAVSLRADAEADRPLGTSFDAGELGAGSAYHLAQRPKLEVTQGLAMQLQPLGFSFHDFPFRSSIVAFCFPSP